MWPTSSQSVYFSLPLVIGSSVVTRPKLIQQHSILGADRLEAWEHWRPSFSRERSQQRNTGERCGERLSPVTCLKPLHWTAPKHSLNGRSFQLQEPIHSLFGLMPFRCEVNWFVTKSQCNVASSLLLFVFLGHPRWPATGQCHQEKRISFNLPALSPKSLV